MSLAHCSPFYLLSGVTALALVFAGCAIDDRVLVETDEEGNPVSGSGGSKAKDGSGGGGGAEGEDTGFEYSPEIGAVECEPLTAAPAIIPLDGSTEAQTIACGSDSPEDGWLNDGVGLMWNAAGDAPELYGAVSSSLSEEGDMSLHCHEEPDDEKLCITGLMSPSFTSRADVFWTLRQSYDETCEPDWHSVQGYAPAFYQDILIDMEVDEQTTADLYVWALSDSGEVYCTSIDADSGEQQIALSWLSRNCLTSIEDEPSLSNDVPLVEIGVSALPTIDSIDDEELSAYSFCVEEMGFR